MYGSTEDSPFTRNSLLGRAYRYDSHLELKLDGQHDQLKPSSSQLLVTDEDSMGEGNLPRRHSMLQLVNKLPPAHRESPSRSTNALEAPEGVPRPRLLSGSDSEDLSIIEIPPQTDRYQVQ